jgi:hypothetical protein
MKHESSGILLAADQSFGKLEGEKLVMIMPCNFATNVPNPIDENTDAFGGESKWSTVFGLCGRKQGGWIW